MLSYSMLIQVYQNLMGNQEGDFLIFLITPLSATVITPARIRIRCLKIIYSHIPRPGPPVGSSASTYSPFLKLSTAFLTVSCPDTP